MYSSTTKQSKLTSIFLLVVREVEYAPSTVLQPIDNIGNVAPRQLARVFTLAPIIVVRGRVLARSRVVGASVRAHIIRVRR